MAVLIGNKRCSQLIQLTSTEIQPDDLFYIVDTSARESKKIPAEQLAIYLSASGSLYALHAINADTASYILGSGVYGSVASSLTSSFTVNASSASLAERAISSSWSTTCSFALNVGGIGETQTASFLKYQGVYNGTASYALTSSVVVNSRTASFLQYTIGVNNGTSSYSIRTQNVDHAVRSDTASYFDTSIGLVSHAGTADVATEATHSIYSDSASYLVYSSNNGTASYAIKAGSFPGSMLDYGVFLALTQSNGISSLDNVYIDSPGDTEEATTIESVGTVIVPYTSSITVNESVSLIAKSRDSGVETVLDSTPIFYQLSPTVGDWSTLSSGSIKMPITLLGQSDMLGEYQIFMTASSGIISFEPTRVSRFNISSRATDVTVSSDSQLQFLIYPTSSLITFSSSIDPNGPFMDYLPGLYTTGSSNITVINVSGSLISSIKYIWTLTNLQELVINDNFPLTRLPGLPNSVSTMSCYSCSISTITDMNNIPSMSYFLCNDNDLMELPKLPISLSLLDCQRNLLTSLPEVFPAGLTQLYCGDNDITNLPMGMSASSLNVLMAESNSLTTIPAGFVFPPLLYTMSFANNLYLTDVIPHWPVSMSYLDLSQCDIYDIPDMPESASYISMYSSSLSVTAIEDMATELVSNGLSNGYLDIRGTGIPSTNALIQLGTLIVRSWTVLYDT